MSGDVPQQNCGVLGSFAVEEPQQLSTLDTHPLIREYFGEQLKQRNHPAWQEAHRRLYEYYASQAVEHPTTTEEMAKLFTAVVHGCEAGLHQKVYEEVYRERICRRENYYATSNLGAIGADLSALYGFFEHEVPYSWNRLVPGFDEDAQGFILNAAGYDLGALGRLKEGVGAMKAALEIHTAQAKWPQASIDAHCLSTQSALLGEFDESLHYATQSVEFADRGDQPGERWLRRTTLGSVLHWKGKLSEAQEAFEQAEAILKQVDPRCQFLHSLGGFRYCDLLLEKGEYPKVQTRAMWALDFAQKLGRLRDVALDHLSLGRAYLLQVQLEHTSDFSLAEEELNNAVDMLQEASREDELPRALLARAEYLRARDKLKEAETDINTAWYISRRGDYLLHQADCCLEYVRFYLVTEDAEKAREKYLKAKDIIGTTGYHRRDSDIRSLGEKLGM